MIPAGPFILGIAFGFIAGVLVGIVAGYYYKHGEPE